ncbi:MAG: ArsR family transcriptional regulator [Armatimonadota bacterium]|nr:ArsR family transcriptional regulator [Armatimonadota bacterium]
MKVPKWNKRLLSSTRGRIIGLLRSSARTVNELAEELKLTDNAVRSHLSTLERDGLVEQSGVRPGLTKPHAIYELTAEAEQLFPKAYAPMLNQVLDVLDERFAPEVVEAVLREVGRRLAADYLPAAQGEDVEGRVHLVQKVFGELGGLAEVERQNGHFVICGDSCPLTAVSATHPAVCRLAETLVTEIAGAPAQECCKYDPTPQCCFKVKADESIASCVRTAKNVSLSPQEARSVRHQH